MPKSDIKVISKLPSLLKMRTIDLLLCNTYIALKQVMPSITPIDAVRVFKSAYDISEDDLSETTATHIIYRYTGRDMKELTKSE